MAKFEINWMDDRSDEALLAEIRRVAALMPDRRLGRRDFKSHAQISTSTIERPFGSWSEAMRRAGLADALPNYSDQPIFEDLRRVADSFPDEPFTSAFYVAHGRYSQSLFKRRFGGWHEALQAAGIAGRFVGPATTERMRSQPGRALKNEDILAKIRDIAAGLGKVSLSNADISDNSEINTTLLRNRFGSVSEALRQADVVPIRRRHTEDEVFENLLLVWTHYGRPPTVSEIDNPPSKIRRDAYSRRYGGWRNALRAFIQRANLETKDELHFGPGTDALQLADEADPSECPAIGAGVSIRTKPHRSPREAPPRITRPAQTNVRPEDRRDPPIGLRFRVLSRDLFRCCLCGRSPATELDCILHVDHIHPFSKGGKTTFENLRSLCSHCNVGKSNG